jgi:chitin disaccharide deacetylase
MAGDSLGPMATLAERLGYRPDDRVLIINCDDLGSCHAANVGVYEALRDGVATSASLMVPCPWARDAAARYRGEDVGVHLTLNAEHDLYRWGPITHAPSLLDGDGGFPRTLRDVWDHADLDEARRELRAQVERAILWGFDVSHLDSHMGTLQLKAEFFDIYLDLALEFGLPIRLSGASTERTIGFPFRKLAEEEGAVFPDHFVYVHGGVGSRRDIERTVHNLQPGVTEVYVHPAVDYPELRALTGDWAARVDDHDLVVTDRSLRTMLERAGASLIGYRELRDLQRTG